MGCVSAGCLQQWCVALTVSTQMVQHASTHGRFTAWGSHHLLSSIPPSISLFFSPSTSVTLFLSAFCICCPCLHWSALLSVSVSVCPTVSLYVSFYVTVCCPDAANQPCRHGSNALKRRISVYYNLDLTFIV